MACDRNEALDDTIHECMSDRNNGINRMYNFYGGEKQAWFFEKVPAKHALRYLNQSCQLEWWEDWKAGGLDEKNR